MNYSEEQIITKTTELLQSWNSLNDNYQPNSARFDENEILRMGPSKGDVHPCWIVLINDTSFLDTYDFLIISDVTGEPLYIQTKHQTYEIHKDSNGKYILDIDME